MPAIRWTPIAPEHETTMAKDMKSAKQVGAEVRHAWSEAAAFLLSIELWLMVLVAASTVAGFWLAFMVDLRCLLAFGFATGYLAARVVLHLKRLLAWPFF